MRTAPSFEKEDWLGNLLRNRRRVSRRGRRGELQPREWCTRLWRSCSVAQMLLCLLPRLPEVVRPVSLCSDLWILCHHDFDMMNSGSRRTHLFLVFEQSRRLKCPNYRHTAKSLPKREDLRIAESLLTTWVSSWIHLLSGLKVTARVSRFLSISSPFLSVSRRLKRVPAVSAPKACTTAHCVDWKEGYWLRNLLR